MNYIEKCNLCPRNCNVQRNLGELGYCRSGADPKIALVSIHNWEEPSISGTNGSGTVFFSGCNLRCVFCQNHDISSDGFGRDISIERLSNIFLNQQSKGVHNINLVTPTHFIPQIASAIRLAKKNNLKIPVVYNTSGYEKAESLNLLDGLIDIYLPDMKYFSSELSMEFSNAPDYFEFASKAILEMFRQTGKNIFDSNGIMTKGIIIRHLILPSCKEDSKKILDWINKNLGNNVYVSLLNQYTPMYKAKDIKKLNRKLTTYEYQNVVDYFFNIGLKNGYVQKKSAATSAYTPIFDLSGI